MVCLVDALSFTALIMFHYKNFKESRTPDELAENENSPPNFNSSINEETVMNFTKLSGSENSTSLV